MDVSEKSRNVGGSHSVWSLLYGARRWRRRRRRRCTPFVTTQRCCLCFACYKAYYGRNWPLHGRPAYTIAFTIDRPTPAAAPEEQKRYSLQIRCPLFDVTDRRRRSGAFVVPSPLDCDLTLDISGWTRRPFDQPRLGDCRRVGLLWRINFVHTRWRNVDKRRDFSHISDFGLAMMLTEHLVIVVRWW